MAMTFLFPCFFYSKHIFDTGIDILFIIRHNF